jgi:hypothetical protein
MPITNVAGRLAIVVMGIFVDNLLITGNSVAEIAAVYWQEKMKSIFVSTDQRELQYYLGIANFVRFAGSTRTLDP